MEKSRLLQLQHEIGLVEDTRRSFKWAAQHTEDEEIRKLYTELIDDANNYTSFLSSKASELRRQRLVVKDPLRTKQTTWQSAFFEEIKAVWQAITFGNYGSYDKV